MSFKMFKQFKHSYLKHKAWSFSNKGNGPAELSIFDEISPFGMNENLFSNELKEFKGQDLVVNINSPGGDVFSGLTIFNMLKDHDAKVTTNIMGLAASISSVIALAGDEVRMSENALMMIHKPFSFVLGDADDMRGQANVLDKVEESITKVYRARTNLTDDEIKLMMRAETWFNAEQAKQAGFIDTVVTSEQPQDAFDLSMFNNAPDTDVMNVRRLEAVLRDAGLSSKKAKALLSGGFSAIADNQRDAELIDGLQNLSKLMRG